MFDSSSFPPDYPNGWLDGLVDALLQLLQNKYLSAFPHATLEAEVWSFLTNTSASPSRQLREASQSAGKVFYADINLLPESLENEDIQAIHQVMDGVCIGLTNTYTRLNNGIMLSSFGGHLSGGLPSWSVLYNVVALTKESRASEVCHQYCYFGTRVGFSI